MLSEGRLRTGESCRPSGPTRTGGTSADLLERTTERQHDGTTGTEETQTAADTSGTAADNFGNPEVPTPGKTFILLKKPLGPRANGIPSGRYSESADL